MTLATSPGCFVPEREASAAPAVTSSVCTVPSTVANSASPEAVGRPRSSNAPHCAARVPRSASTRPSVRCGVNLRAPPLAGSVARWTKATSPSRRCDCTRELLAALAASRTSYFCAPRGTCAKERRPKAGVVAQVRLKGVLEEGLEPPRVAPPEPKSGPFVAKGGQPA
jgi:hypothetical protein